MPIWAKDNRREFTPAPEGLHQGVCVDVVDLGMVESGKWGAKHKVRIIWQLEQRDEETDRRFTVSQSYNISLNEKATLRHHLEAWRGRKFTAEELQGFDLEKLIGVNCQIQVVHNIADDKRVWANVQAIVPVGKGMTKIQPEDYVRVKDRDTAPATNGASATDDEDVPF